MAPFSYLGIQKLGFVKLVNHSLFSSQLSLEFNATETWVSSVAFRRPQKVTYCPLSIILTLFVSHFPSQTISVQKKKKKKEGE